MNEPLFMLRTSYEYKLFENVRIGRRYENFALDHNNINSVPMTILSDDVDVGSVLTYSLTGGLFRFRPAMIVKTAK